MKNLNDLFGEFLASQAKPKTFEELVEVALNKVPELQQQLADIEKALLAMKANNNCDNNIPLITGAMEFADSGPAFLASIGDIGAAHAHMHHGDMMGDGDIKIVGISGDDLPPELQAIFGSIIRRMMRR